MNEFSERPEMDEPGAASGLPLKSRIMSFAAAILGSRVVLVLLSVATTAALVYFVASSDGFAKRSHLEQEKLKLEAEIEMLKDENRLYRQKLDRLQNDPAYVEDEARKKLGLIRPNEFIYRLSEEPDLAEDQPSAPTAPKP